jgi:UDP-N-acetylmuramyl pentapeptide synthase
LFYFYSILDGALFIALCGDNFDAHDYVKQAQKMGAVALLVSKKVESSLPTLVVENTQEGNCIVSFSRYISPCKRKRGYIFWFRYGSIEIQR